MDSIIIGLKFPYYRPQENPSVIEVGLLEMEDIRKLIEGNMVHDLSEGTEEFNLISSGKIYRRNV